MARLTPTTDLPFGLTTEAEQADTDDVVLSGVRKWRREPPDGIGSPALALSPVRLPMLPGM
ncbi:hypothetical protein GCM10009525_58220 [Streptosporangium amethystogenes subsp. fukuiense]